MRGISAVLGARRSRWRRLELPHQRTQSPRMFPWAFDDHLCARSKLLGVLVTWRVANAGIKTIEYGSMLRLALLATSSGIGGVALTAGSAGGASVPQSQGRRAQTSLAHGCGYSAGCATPGPATRSCAPCMASSCRRCPNLKGCEQRIIITKTCSTGPEAHPG